MSRHCLLTSLTAALALGLGACSNAEAETDDEGEMGPGNALPSPGTQNPGAQNPGAQNPGAQNPGGQNPGAQNPGAQDPGAQDPGAQDPGAQDPGAQDPGAQDPDPGTANPNACDFNGAAAVKITAQVTWGAGLAVEAGQGQLEIYFLANLSHSGVTVQATGPVCGVNVPDFRTNALAGGDVAGTIIPDRVWTSPGLPQTVLTAVLGGAEAGATLRANPTAMMLGATMADPLNAPWPTSFRDLQPADHDGDGKPGITAMAATGGQYMPPRVDILDPNKRADQLYLGLRTIIGLDGIIDSCNGASGSATLALDQRVVGCHLTTGQECADANVQLIDNNVPQFVVTNAVFELKRIASGDCGSVKAAF